MRIFVAFLFMAAATFGLQEGFVLNYQSAFALSFAVLMLSVVVADP